MNNMNDMNQMNDMKNVNNDASDSNAPSGIIVQESPRELKSLARSALSGIWASAFLGMLIYALLMQVIPAIIEMIFPNFKYTFTYPDIDYAVSYSPIPYIYQLLLAGPIIVGQKKFLLQIVRRKEANYNNLFSGFKNFGRTFLLQLLIGILMMLWSIPGIAVASVVAIIAPSMVLIGLIAMVALILWAYLKYFMAPYYMADNPDLKPMDAIRISKNIMNGNKGGLFGLMFSFIGWLFIGAIPEVLLLQAFPNASGIMSSLIWMVGMIPSYLVSLYLTVSETFFYEILTGHLKREEQQFID